MEQHPAPNPLLVWWILWFAILSGLVMLFFFLGGGATTPSAGPLTYFPLIPLALGAFVRWVVLPRMKTATQALPVFMIGLALSEGSGILSFVLVPEMRNTYFILALLGVIQFIPLFASRYSK